MNRARKAIQTSNHKSAFVMDFGDYHDIDYYLEDHLSQGFRCKEIAFGQKNESGYARYWGLFYKGRKPAKNKIIEMLEEKEDAYVLGEIQIGPKN